MMHGGNLKLSPTCFEQPCVHPQEDLYMQFYGIFMHPYKQCGRCQDVFDEHLVILVEDIQLC